MLYADYLSTAEMQRWDLDTDIAWDDIDGTEVLIYGASVFHR